MLLFSATHLATAVGLGDDENYTFTDESGVAWVGRAAHLVVAAVARPDVTPNLAPNDPRAAHHLRGVARVVATWFTCEHTDPEHAAAFAALAPWRVCEIVAHVAEYANLEPLERIGPAGLRRYTSYLLGDFDPNGYDFPRDVEESTTRLGGWRLEITPVTPDGADKVELRIHVEASKVMSWSFVAPLELEATELNDVLMDVGLLSQCIEISDYLTSERSVTDDSETRVEIVAPTTPLTYPTEEATA